MSGFDFTVRTKEDLIGAVGEFGFVPLFANSLPGFSVEEHADPRVWFSGDEGVWEWKGPVIREARCAYGKFFERKAAFVSGEWFPDLANLRRDGYNFEARWEEGLVPYRDRDLYLLLEEHGPVLSKSLKGLGDYRRGGRKGFDSSMGRLQAQCYALISDFVYETDRTGAPRGWGLAEYSTPERFFGEAFTEEVFRRTPEESRERVLARLRELLPGAGEEALRRFLG